jgi:hypothetical protein
MTSQPPDNPTPPDAPVESTSPIAAPAPAPAAAPSAVFQPVPRAPRVPWVNPDRRSQVVGSSIIAALVLLGAGFGIGYASSSDGHGDSGPARMERGGGFPPGLREGRVGHFPGGQLPGNHQRGMYPLPATAVPATPAPTSTK